MNKNIALLIVSVSLMSGCASLRSQVAELREGDSREMIIHMMGQPVEFKPYTQIPGATLYSYVSAEEICSLVVEKNKLVSTSCIANPNHQSAYEIYQESYKSSWQAYQDGSRGY